MRKMFVLSTALAVFCSLISGCSIGFGWYSVYSNGDEYSVGNATFTDKIEKIDIDWVAGEVSIESHDAQTVSLEESCNKALTDELSVHYLLDGTTLYIKFAASGQNLGVSLRKSLTVRLPSSFLTETLTVNAASAKVSVKGITLNTADIQTASGAIAAELSAQQTVLQSASGAINASLSEAGEVDLNTASGAISLVVSGNADTVSAKAASGKVSLTLDSAGAVTARTASGSVNVAAGQLREVNLDSTSGAVKLAVDETPDKCKISTTSGKIQVSLPSDAGFTANTKSTSGSVRCEFAAVANGNTYVCGDGSAELSLSSTSGSITIAKK